MGVPIYCQTKTFVFFSDPQILFPKIKSRYRKRYSRDHETATPNIGTLCRKSECNYPPKTSTINISSTSSRKDPIASRGFSLQNPSSEATAIVVLRIHRCLGLEEPLHNPLCTFQGCEEQRCRASGADGPRPSRRQNPTDQWDKNLRKLWHLTKNRPVPGIPQNLNQSP